MSFSARLVGALLGVGGVVFEIGMANADGCISFLRLG